jgi:Tfp pilus assembly protein PilO
MRYFFLLLLIIACIGVFIAFITPRYHDVQAMRANVTTYNTNLVTATKLQASRNSLIAQYNGISKADIDNIDTLLPDSVDDIRLIIQINSLATKDGLDSLTNVDYDPGQAPTSAGGTITSTTGASPSSKQATDNLPYGQFVISFQTGGPYSNFLSFISDLEQNLRLVDVTSVAFIPTTPGANGGAASATSGLSYKITLQTYWLK